jgi:predicted LPLAT superfamily acyltransferase
MAMTARHWAGIGESTFVAGMWFLYAVHRVFGRVPFLLCLYPVVLYYWATRGLARRASRQYLERLSLFRGGPVPTWRSSVRHFLSFADTILDKTLALSGRYRF